MSEPKENKPADLCVDGCYCPHVDVDVKPDNVEKDFLDVLAVIRPEWDEKDLQFERSPIAVSRGCLNTMVKCFNEKCPEDAIMIRVHNTSITMLEFINRNVEVLCITKLQEKKCAPELLATFRTGFCYEFIHGEILNKTLLPKEPIWRLIADELAKIHSANFEGEGLDKSMNKFQAMAQKLWDGYPTGFDDPVKDERFKNELPDKEVLKKEYDDLKEHLTNFVSPTLLCHNDTRAENIIWNEKTGVLRFVDFEVMNYNFQAAEISSHFLRFGGLDPPDFRLYPDEPFQLKWLTYYLERLNSYTGKDPPTEREIRTLFVQCEKHHLLNLLISAVACPMMEKLNLIKVEGLDMLNFGILGIQEYYRLKDSILALEIPSD